MRAELHGVQMMRAIAALAVVTHHALKKSGDVAGSFSPDWLTLSMSAGVDIFFVLSGFIMFYISFGPGAKTPDWRDFLTRRVIRIYPFYWVCASFVVVLGLAGILKKVTRDPVEIVNTLALLPGWNHILFVSWTLSYEMYFYLVFAIMLVFRSKLVSLIAVGGVICGIMLLALLLPPGPVRSFLGYSITVEFCFGLLLAYLFGRAGSRFRLPVLVAIPAFAIMIAATILFPGAGVSYLPEPYRALVWGLPAVVALAAFLPVGRPQGRAGKLLVDLGDASYAIYLTHTLVIIAYAKLLQRAAIAHFPQIALVPLVIVASAVLGLIVHRWIEIPLIARLRSWTRRRLRIVPVPAVVL